MDGQRRYGLGRAGGSTSRRAFLRGAAAAGVGAAVATLWDPANLMQLQPAHAATAPVAAGGSSRPGAWIADGGMNQAEDERSRMAHLLRRASFSATPAEIDAMLPLGIAGAVDALLNYDQVQDPAPDYANSVGLDLSKTTDAIRWWLLRMIYTTRPLQEKLTLFWHGILTSAVSKVGQRNLNTLLAQNEFLRANATGTYDVLLKGISRDPAMMVWLDLQTSTKAHPNENFARELQELFSLGIGNYGEDDVREAARAFTGYQLDKDRHFVYNARQHDDGAKTYLGQTGNWSGDDIINIILQQRAAAEYISKRLWSFFAYPNPEPDVVSTLADTFQSSSYSIKAVLRQLFTMPQFYSDAAMGALVKSPTEFVVGAVRSLGLQTDGSTFPQQMALMNQTLFNPPSVAGWPGGPTWLSSSTFFARLNFLNGLIYARIGGPTSSPDATRLLGDYASLAADEAIGTAATRLLGIQLGGSSQQIVAQFLSDSNGGTPRVTDKNVKSFLYLVLATPEGQLL
ncbi:MAG TPA: DUF1800 domain-containing protein [Dehalococcoidia bacterium]